MWDWRLRSTKWAVPPLGQIFPPKDWAYEEAQLVADGVQCVSFPLFSEHWVLCNLLLSWQGFLKQLCFCDVVKPNYFNSYHKN